MNRFSLVAAPPKIAASRIDRRSRTAVYAAKRHDSPHCLLAPMHYERNYAYPLVVWLHAPGSDELEIKRIMPLISLRNYVALAVRGTGDEHSGFAWPTPTERIAAAAPRNAAAIA